MLTAPIYIDVFFIVLVFLLSAALTHGIFLAQVASGKKSSSAAKISFWIGGGISFWLGVTGTLACMGVFQDFESLPPKIAFVIFPSILATVFLGSMKWTRKVAQGASTQAIITLQGFRIWVEIILLLLISHGLLPELMSFKGRNFDILVGITAVGIGITAFHKGKLKSKNWTRTVRIWNAIGALILVSTVFHGLLAAPTRFRIFYTLPSTAIIGTFPYIWLPTFLVPVAFFLHLVLTHKLRK